MESGARAALHVLECAPKMCGCNGTAGMLQSCQRLSSTSSTAKPVVPQQGCAPARSTKLAAHSTVKAAALLAFSDSTSVHAWMPSTSVNIAQPDTASHFNFISSCGAHAIICPWAAATTAASCSCDAPALAPAAASAAASAALLASLPSSAAAPAAAA